MLMMTKCMPALSAYTERNNIFLKKKYHL